MFVLSGTDERGVVNYSFQYTYMYTNTYANIYFCCISYKLFVQVVAVKLRQFH